MKTTDQVGITSGIGSRQIISQKIRQPENLQKQLHAAASDAFASGFAVVGVVAAVLAGGACIAAFGLVRSSETAPAGGTTNRVCKMADCPIP